MSFMNIWKVAGELHSMGISDWYLLYVKTCNSCTTLVTINIDVIWRVSRDSHFSDPILLDTLPAVKTHLEAHSPDTIQMGVQFDSSERSRGSDRIMLLEIYGSNNSTGFAFKAWVYRVSPIHLTLDHHSAGQSDVLHDVLQEGLIQEQLHVPPECIRVDISPLSECSRVILRCTHRTGYQQFRELMIVPPWSILGPDNVIEASGTRCKYIMIAGGPGGNREVGVIRKVTVDARSSALLWTSQLSHEIRVTFYE
ncbi:hypothetical protein EW145_g2922 [Phellinidium pouzarii]|uniref:Uncharacterized protein n=1 Tax=Phellinidium pouzarii TaxID=167371 RepID=A0A4S4L979_9AGAM|nr:hypothetical protein EW145_g2922 [Phellinidium pouzarii]